MKGASQPSPGMVRKRSIKEVVADANSPLSQRPKSFCAYSPVTESHAGTIKTATGLDVGGYSRVIAEDDVRHTLFRHGPGGIADKSVVNVDFDRLPEIIASPDRISPGETVGTIEYRKRLSDQWLVVEERRSGKKSLAFKTMYKEKSG